MFFFIEHLLNAYIFFKKKSELFPINYANYFQNPIKLFFNLKTLEKIRWHIKKIKINPFFSWNAKTAKLLNEEMLTKIKKKAFLNLELFFSV